MSYKKFYEEYAPYVYLWVVRMCLIVMAYVYHSSKGFLLLTWVLLSFVVPTFQFVSFTVVVVVPIFTIDFLWLYFINIPGFTLV